MFCKKVVIENFAKFTGKTCTRVIFNEEIWYRCFPFNFAIFWRTAFLKKQHIRWLLLSETKLRKIIDVFIYLFVYLFICLFTYLPIYFTLTIYNESIMWQIKKIYITCSSFRKNLFTIFSLISAGPQRTAAL